MDVERFVPELGFEIFFLYHQITHLKIRLWVKNTLVVYSRAIIAFKMCRKVTFGLRFENNFWTVRNVYTWSYFSRKFTFGAWIRTQILYFFDGNRECYCCLYLAQRVTRNTDSNYKPKEGRKSGSLTLCSQIWDGNIFPISRGQSFLNQILGKKYIGGKNFSTNFVFVQRKLRE